MQVVRCLRAGPDGELAVGILGGDGGVLLDGEMRVALIKESVFKDFVGFGEALIDVAEFQGDAFMDVAFIAVIVNARRRSGQSLLWIGDSGQQFVFDFDQVQSLKCDQLFASDYGGDGITNMADVINAQGLLILTDRKDSVFDGEIFAGEDKVDAGVSGSARSIDAANARVGVRRAQ